MAFDESVAQRVRDVLSEECVALERRMFGGLAFMVNGHMCCGIVGEDLVGPHWTRETRADIISVVCATHGFYWPTDEGLCIRQPAWLPFKGEPQEVD